MAYMRDDLAKRMGLRVIAVNADVTLATIQIDPNEVYRFGVVGVDRDHRVPLLPPERLDLRPTARPGYGCAQTDEHQVEHPVRRTAGRPQSWNGRSRVSGMTVRMVTYFDEFQA